jgi:hypothetical protein
VLGLFDQGPFRHLILARKHHRGVDLISDVPESFLIAGWRMIRPQSTRKAQMKIILMLIVGLMLAGCGSTGNHVRNRDAVDRNRYLVDHTAVDTICACP